MFTYTSCGWFFNDISGIEPRQNIAYAMYAAQLLNRFSNTDLCSQLLEDLKLAKSNVEDQGNGSQIALCDMPQRKNFFNACSYFAMNRLVADPSDYTDDWGFMHLESHNENTMTIVNTRTLQTNRITYSQIPYAMGSMGFLLTDMDSGESIRLNVLTSSERSLIAYTTWVESRLSAGFPEAMIDTLVQNIGNYLPLVASHKNLFKETIFTENIGVCIKAMKSLILDQPGMTMEKRLKMLNGISVFVKLKGRNTDLADINEAFEKKLDLYGKMLIKDDCDTKTLSDALSMLDAAREEGFEPKITTFQDAVWAMKDNDLDPELKKRITESLNFMPQN